VLWGIMSMRAGMCRVLAALLIGAIPVVAVAQVIPPSELPGRERERFTQPPTPQAQPAGPSISLPSTVAPEGAEKVFVRINGVRITGSTVYTAEQLAPLYTDLIHQRVPLTAVYALAQRITAKYRLSSSIPAAQSSTSRSSRDTSTRSSGRRSFRATAISSQVTRPRSRRSGLRISIRSNAICCSLATCQD